MNTENRELTVDELDAASGGLFGPLKAAIDQILVAGSSGSGNGGSGSGGSGSGGSQSTSGYYSGYRYGYRYY